jgi:hypothetical protein
MKRVMFAEPEEVRTDSTEQLWRETLLRRPRKCFESWCVLCAISMEALRHWGESSRYRAGVVSPKYSRRCLAILQDAGAAIVRIDRQPDQEVGLIFTHPTKRKTKHDVHRSRYINVGQLCLL